MACGDDSVQLTSIFDFTNLRIETMTTYFRHLLILILFVCAAEPLVQAQTPEDTIKYHYPPITTIGTRYAEPWIQVPLSLSYIQQKDMAQGKGYGLDEALSGIPGVLAQSRAGSTDIRLTIRGFGARGAGLRSNAGTSRGVRILTNGFPETEPDGRTSFDLIDVSGAGAIEVMRSNASSIYGNASGGVVNIISNTMFESPFVSHTESFGSFGFRKELISAGANVGSGKMYFSLGNTTNDGWRYHSRSSQLLLNTGIVANLDEKTVLGVHVSGTSNLFRIPGALTQAQYDSLPQQADSTLFIKRDERRFNRQGRIGITATHELNDNNMIAATAFAEPKYLERSERNQYRQFNRYHVGGSAMYRNLASFSPSFQNTLLLGTDEAYQDGAILFYNRYNVSPNVELGTLRDNKREGANNFGAFLQDEMSIGERWLALLGFRYDNITYYSESFFNRLPPAQSKSFERVTPKAGLTYRISPTHSIYASLGGGVEVPAGNETDPATTLGQDTLYAINPLLEPITSTTIEVGMKQLATLGDNEPFAHLTYDVALYWLQVRNDIIPYSNGTLFFTAGKTERMGIEVGGAVRFTMGLSFNVAFTASSNKYKTYTIDSVHYDEALAGHLANYANNKVVGVPNIFYTIGATYAPEMLKGAYVRFGVQSVGKYFADDANTISVPAYTILNAGIGIDHFNFADDRLFVNVFAGLNNLADTKYIGSAWLNPDYTTVNGVRVPFFIEPGLPRNFVGSIAIGMNM